MRPQTSALFDWDKFDALSVGLESRAAHAPASAMAPPALDEQRQERLKVLFDLFQQQCHEVLIQLRRSAKICFAIIAVAVALAMGGSIVLAVVQSQKVLGGALSLVGLGSLVTVLTRAIGINRDAAMLEVLPTKYQLAFSLATTAKQYDAVFHTFMDETSSLRSGRTRGR